MYIRIRGPYLDQPCISAIAEVANCAQLSPATISHNESTQTVSFAIDRTPAVPRRILPGFAHDGDKPIRTHVVIRNVLSCGVRADPRFAEVQLIFGITVRDGRVYACSAEEDRGTPCLEIDIAVSEVDIELADVGDPPAGGGA